MMIAASLPPHFLAEAIPTSSYIINIQPSSALQVAFLSSVSLVVPVITRRSICLVVFSMFF
jgi:hypothetical protein